MMRRRLSDEEHTLWSGVTRQVKPLRVRRAPLTPQGGGDAAVSAPARPKAMPAAAGLRAPPTLPPAQDLAPLDRRFRRRLASGNEAIDGRLDLHGMTQAEAHGALLRFLRLSQARGARTVLVITGKGGGSGERGVLKRQVPMWLRLPEFRSVVIGLDDAGVRHGGQGALYVRLRRATDTRTPR